ncbi:MAG TPA: S41 family peptidase [Planctomycetota bacterium]|nr:S41 family peptidase [Planctomycetota bacterium]HRR79083.1 S41 family peptidase [Planctomycetota bacterium]HRT93033.1 S41 family peptidase [Planctomycetota bacterium]
MAEPSKTPASPPPPQHLPFLTVVLLLLIALHAFQGPIRSWVSGRYRALAVFGRALDVCLEEYVEPRPASELVHSAVEGMIEGLRDRHSAYLSPPVHRRLQENETDKYAGLGVVIGLTKDERLVINQVFDDSPAARAGLRAGDIILYAIEHDPNGLREPVKRDFSTVKNLNRTSNILRGERGSKVTLGIRRPRKLPDLKDAPKAKNGEEFEVTMVRGEVTRPVIESRLLEPAIGYLSLGDFPDGASERVADGLAGLRAKGARGFVFDLRNNDGGFLDEAVRIADLFLADGVIVSTQNRNPDENRTYHATPGGTAENLPFVVLVNAFSASAAEVLAGCLQDRGRAKLVGTRTYGKGAVSKRFPLGDGSGILLSTGKYILPKGRSIEGTGLEPDLVVQPLPPDEREKLRKTLEPGARLPDPQLDAAVKLLREQLGEAPHEPPVPAASAP